MMLQALHAHAVTLPDLVNVCTSGTCQSSCWRAAITGYIDAPTFYHQQPAMSCDHSDFWLSWELASCAARRADYFGTLPNLAARVSALAAPGQILLEGCHGFGRELQWNKDESLGTMLLYRRTHGKPVDDETIEIHQLGHYLLKVMARLTVGTQCASEQSVIQGVLCQCVTFKNAICKLKVVAHAIACESWRTAWQCTFG